MPNYCLIVARDNDFESSMPSYRPLQWITIFSENVTFLDISCALYSNIGIVLSCSMLHFSLTCLSHLFCLCGEYFIIINVRKQKYDQHCIDS